jgi:hypothetical protein
MLSGIENESGDESVAEPVLEVEESGEVVLVKGRAGFDFDADDSSVGRFENGVDFDSVFGAVVPEAGAFVVPGEFARQFHEYEILKERGRRRRLGRRVVGRCRAEPVRFSMFELGADSVRSSTERTGRSHRRVRRRIARSRGWLLGVNDDVGAEIANRGKVRSVCSLELRAIREVRG